MDSYSTLVSKILKNNTLSLAAVEINANESESQRPSINLITPEWEKVLKEHEDFKNCHFSSGQKPISTEAYYDYETSKNTLFNVTLAAECKFIRKNEELYKGKYPQSNCIIVNNSAPLAKIAQVMTINSGIPIADNHKFKFRDCSPLSCTLCKKGFETFSNKGYNIKKSNQPCIAVTKVFDGKDIYNRFYSQLEDSFKNDDFLAILHLKINVRYKYVDRNNGNQKIYRIGGAVTNMLAFDQAKLDLVQTINLGDVMNIEASFDILNHASTNDSNIDNIEKEQLAILDDLPNIEEEQFSALEDLDDIIDDSENNKRSVIEMLNNEDVKDTLKKPRIQESTFSIDE